MIRLIICGKATAEKLQQPKIIASHYPMKNINNLKF